MKASPISMFAFILALFALLISLGSRPGSVPSVQQPELPTVVADTTEPVQVFIPEASPDTIPVHVGPGPVKPHEFVPSAGHPTVCHVCSQTVYHKNHTLISDGPTPLTEAEFADLQKWLKDGNEIHTWVQRQTDKNKRHVFLGYADNDKICGICDKPENDAIHMKMPEVDWTTCQICKGTGLLHGALCPTCDGASNPKLFTQPPPDDLLTLTNNLRFTLLRHDDQLAQAAQQYADYLARTRQQGHFADGDPEYRARRAGFTGTLRTPVRPDGWVGIGEVTAHGQHTAAEAIDDWLKSPGHKAALLEPSFDVAGFGNCGTTWVGLIGRKTTEADQLKPASNASILSGQFQPTGQSPGRAISVPQTHRGRQYFRPIIEPRPAYSGTAPGDVTGGPYRRR